jgi:hypothetical protein
VLGCVLGYSSVWDGLTDHFVSVKGEDVLKTGFDGFFTGGAMAVVGVKGCV